MQFYSCGVFGLNEDEFFHKLTFNNIDVFIDIRRRRAVRGSKYSFVNSLRLQSKLLQLGIKYLHVSDLAPTNQIRELQKKADAKYGVKKRERTTLSDEFKAEYNKEILNKFDLSKLITKLELMNIKNAILFCVETEPDACHRSLVSNKLASELSIQTQHL